MSLVASQEGAATEQHIIQKMANDYILSPEPLHPLDNIALREPLTEMITVSLTTGTWMALSEIAEGRGVAMAALLRNMILCGLRKEGIM